MQDFDHIAERYDEDFTQSPIGKAQRGQVHALLSDFLRSKSALNILEINCGTGEDAAWLAAQGHRVLATDVSPNMVLVASDRLENLPNVSTQVLDIRTIQHHANTYDLIFSDFGGLNCLSPDEMKSVATHCRNSLTENGSLIFVIMGRKCFWERIYFILKGSFRKAFRRNRRTAVQSNVDGKKVNTWYYSPKEIKSFFKHDFETILVKPIGLFVPPSYLNPFFKNRPRLLQKLESLDRRFRFSFLADWGDHYCIECRLVKDRAN